MEEPEVADLREAYANVGDGVTPALVKLFRPALGDWCTVNFWGARVGQPRSYPVQDLFARSIPSEWGVARVEVRAIKAGRKRRGTMKVVVQGILHFSAYGTWEVWRVPFVHIWTMTSGQVTKVASYMDGIEITRCASA